MPLFEHMPYTNFENVNLDWIVKTIKTHQTDIDQLKADVGDMKTTIINIQGDITTIYETIEGLDIDSILSRIGALEEEYTRLHNNLNTITLRVVADEEDIAANTTRSTTNSVDIANNDIGSRNRDDALAARIAQLERAHLHDVYNYYAEGNQCIFGSDLREIPTSCKTSDGYPVGWGNKGNKDDSGEAKPRTFKFVDNGLVADTSTEGYDYYQVGMYASGLLNEAEFTVTFAVSTGGDATPAWYTHTFQSSSDIWTVAEGCQVKYSNFYRWTGADDFYKTVVFMGTASDWNTFLNGKYIVFMFVENGSGSVAHAATDKCRFEIKDRLYFAGTAPVPTPTLPEKVCTGTGSAEATVTYYDQVGEPHTITSQVTATVSAKKYGKVVNGYVNVRMNLTNNIGDLLARGAQFTISGLAMTYDADANLPMPDSSSRWYGSANDSVYYEWDYINTQNAYLFANIASNGTWNIKVISSGLRNYTGAYNSYTDLRIPIDYIATT